MLDRFRNLIDDVIGAETPPNDDNEEAKIKWIIDEFDFRNNNDELIQGIDIAYHRNSSRKPSFRVRKVRNKPFDTTPGESESSSLTETSSSWESSSESSLQEDKFEQFHKHKDQQRRLLTQYYLICFILINFIFWAEQFYRKPLQSYSIKTLIPAIQGDMQYLNLWQTIFYCSNGRELNMVFLYHMIFSGKYHRAFMISIHIASFFMISNCLQLLYQDPRPFWESHLGGYAKVYQCAQGFGNPCGQSMSAAMFASLVICERKSYGIFFAVLWVSLVVSACLVLGTNSLNQILFGLMIGFWLASTIIFILDYQKRVTRHFQKLIRGRNGLFLDENIHKTLRTIMKAMALSNFLFLLIYFGVDLYLDKSTTQIRKINGYFVQIQQNCGIAIQPNRKMSYFHESSIFNIGYLMTYFGVYLGALYRHKYHGLQRIDYTQYLEYDNKPCKYFWHVILMFITRTLILFIFFVLPFIITPNFYMTEDVYLIGDNEYFMAIFVSVFPIFIFAIFSFAYFELLCQYFDIDVNHFELIAQDDVNQIMWNLMSQKYQIDLNDLDTSNEYEAGDQDIILEQQMLTTIAPTPNHPGETSVSSNREKSTISRETPFWEQESEQRKVYKMESQAREYIIESSSEYDNEQDDYFHRTPNYQPKFSEMKQQDDIETPRNINGENIIREDDNPMRKQVTFAHDDSQNKIKKGEKKKKKKSKQHKKEKETKQPQHPQSADYLKYQELLKKQKQQQIIVEF